jgi:MFS transporter, CP family, cyanate transporter
VTDSTIAPSTRLGAAVAVAGTVLVGLNLRPTVVSVPAIYSTITRDFAIGTAAKSVLGALPVFSFAIFGALAPRLARSIGLVRSLVVAMAIIGLGQLGRAYLSDSAVAFAIFSVVSFAGIGFGNVLAPQVIRHFFPRRIPQMTSVYLACTIVGASIPSLIAVPSSDAIGWRSSLGVWGIFGLIAVLPWLALLKANVVPAHSRAAKLPVWRSLTAWSVAALLFVGASLTYTLIEWLPPLVNTTDHVSRGTAGVMLSLFTLVVLPINLVIPRILARSRRPYVVVGITAVCAIVGPLGFVVVPHQPWLWVVIAGAGSSIISIALTLVNLRTRTEQATGQLSGFAQGTAYLVAGAGPILVGYLHSATNSWDLPCVFLAALGAVAAVAGVLAVRPVNIEDDLASALTPPGPAAHVRTIQGPELDPSTHTG